MYRLRQRSRKFKYNLLNWLRKYFGVYSSSRRRKYANDRGVALPLVIGIGLLMLLLAITVITRAQSSQINSSNLKQAAQASEVAEAGVIQIQSLFNQFRQLPRITLENITVSPVQTTWTRAASIFPAACGTTSSTSTLLNSILKKNGTITPAWVTLDSNRRFRVISYDYSPVTTSGVSSNATVGAFTVPTSTAATSVVVTPSNYLTSGGSVYGQISGIPGTLTNTSGSYTFKSAIALSSSVSISANSTFYPISNTNANNDTGIGNLWVEGQVLSGTTVIGTSGLQVGIPVNPGDIQTFPIPGTWIGSTFDTISNNRFDADTLLGCNIDPAEVNVVPPRTKKKTEVMLPEAPTPPAGTVNLGSISGNGTYTLPRTSGYNPATGAYEYIVNSISGNGSVYINPNYKVTLYLQGSIDKLTDIVYTNQPSAYPSGYPPFNVSTPTTTVTLSAFTVPTSGASVTTTPSNLSYLADGQSVHGILGSGNIPGRLSRSGLIYSFTPNAAPSSAITVSVNSVFTPSTSFKPPNFKIYGNGPAGSSICIKGNRDIYAFILAPNYAVGMTGTSQFIGAVWASGWGIYPNGNNFTCSSNNPNVVIYQNASWDDISGLAPVNLPPIVQPIQTWNKKEAT